MGRRAHYIERVTQGVFRRILRTRPVAAAEASPVEVLTLLDKRNVVNYLVMIKSLFLSQAPAPAVTILSDGSLGQQEVRTLRRHVVGARVLDDGDLPRLAPEAARLVSEGRRECVFLPRLIGLPAVARSPLLLYLDSDVVFRRPTDGRLSRLPEGVAVTYNTDHDHSRYDPNFHYALEYMAHLGRRPVTNLNGGVMLWDRARLLALDALGFLRHVKHRHGTLHHLVEQDAFNVLASQVEGQPLPGDYLVLSNWEADSKDARRAAVTIHHVGAARYESLAYLRDGWGVIRSLAAPSRVR